jgi:hypothetical protein
MRPIGKYLEELSINSTIFIFINFITNINNMAIAPTYTIQKIIAINSTPNNKSNAEELPKVRTKKNTE